MSHMTVERTYHPNGQLSWEASSQDGKLQGLVRLWHDNGVLSDECPHDAGLPHGRVRHWNRQGELLGEYYMDHGTGTELTWYENGQVESESHSVGGKVCGRTRCWCEDGSLAGEEYYVMNKKVPRKEYDEAAKGNPVLPQSSTAVSKPRLGFPSPRYRHRSAAASRAEREEHDRLISQLLAKPNQAEARRWLAQNHRRNVGDMVPEESRRVIDRGYRAGAVKIMAVEIADRNTSCLIVALPPGGGKRQQVFVWANKLCQRSDFDPYDDWGQRQLFVYLS